MVVNNDTNHMTNIINNDTYPQDQYSNPQWYKSHDQYDSP